MKILGSLSGALLALVSFSSLAHADQVYVGQTVVETFDGNRSMLRVNAVAQNGTAQLSNGVWYNLSYLHQLISSSGNITQGQTVEESFDGNRSILTVSAITTEPDFLLSNNVWYARPYLHILQQSLGNFYVGETVEETFDGNRSLLQITMITDENILQLSNGVWYSPTYLHALENNDAKFRLGETVEETFDGNRTLLQIQEMSDDGTVQLTNGVWYSESYLRALVDSLNGYSIGEPVMETFDGYHMILTILHITEDGIYQLSNGVWYSANYIQQANVQPPRPPQPPVGPGPGPRPPIPTPHPNPHPNPVPPPFHPTPAPPHGPGMPGGH